MRLVIVGVGSIGRRHGRLLCERSSAEDVQVELREPSAEMAAAAREEGWAEGLVVHGSYDAALASGPDGVLLCTPHAFHAEQVRFCTRCLGCTHHHAHGETSCLGVAFIWTVPWSAAGNRGAWRWRARPDREATVRDAGGGRDHGGGGPQQPGHAGGRLHAALPPGAAAGAADGGLPLSPTPPELAVGCALKLRVRLHQVAEGLLGTLCHVHWHIGSLRTLMNSKSSYQATLEGALILDYAHQPDNVLWMTSDMPTTVSAGLSPEPDYHIETNARVSTSKRHTCVHGDQCHI